MSDRQALAHNRIVNSHPKFHWRVRLNAAEWDALRGLCEVDDVPSRGHGLAWLELVVRGDSLAREPRTADRALALLEPLAGDPRKLVHLAAFGLLEEFLDPWPHKLWSVAGRLIHAPDTEVAELVPAFILESLLEHHFDLYYPLVGDAIEAGDRHMAEALNGCYILGQAEAHFDEIVDLLRRHGIEPRFGRVRADETGGGAAVDES